MPGLDGFRLKKNLISRGCATAVIMIAGLGGDDLERQTLEAGAI
jgi:FixJ family two-component response regulator